MFFIYSNVWFEIRSISCSKFILSSSNYEINISHFKESFYIIKFFGNLDELICIKKVIKSNKK